MGLTINLNLSIEDLDKVLALGTAVLETLNRLACPVGFSVEGINDMKFTLPDDTPDGAVQLGPVTVKDAEGQVITAGVSEKLESDNTEALSFIAGASPGAPM